MNRYRILLCDDNPAIHESLANYLTEQGFEVISAFDGESAVEKVKKEPVDVVLLDIMLPGIDGFETCREIRKISDVYIIMLSARSEEIDRVLGLELGADDYVAKPFSPREVTIRIKRAMNRLHAPEERKKFKVGELTVYPDSYQAFVNNEQLQLSPKEFEVLAYLMSNEGKVMTREHILNAVWSYDFFGDTRVVDTMIKTLRQKIYLEGAHYSITTVYGVGYKIEEKL